MRGLIVRSLRSLMPPSCGIRRRQELMSFNGLMNPAPVLVSLPDGEMSVAVDWSRLATVDWLHPRRAMAKAAAAETYGVENEVPESVQ
jgi:hypothetical protein